VRMVFGGLAALAVGLTGQGTADAKPRLCGDEKCGGKCCKSRRTKGKKFCVPKAYTCCPTGGACSGSYPKCCTAQGRPRHAPGYCGRPNATCCPWSVGGHVCSAEYPVCCRARPGYPDGVCTRKGRICCPVGAGTTCPATHPVCCPAVGTTPKYCCALGSTCGVGDCVFGNPFTADSGDGEPPDTGPAPSARIVATA
jgi:hypothetical protein